MTTGTIGTRRSPLSKVTDPESVEAQLERLKVVRDAAAEIGRKRERITGELAAGKKRAAELEQEAEDQFKCKPDGLRNLAADMTAEADKALTNAEAILAGGGGDGDADS